MTITIYYKFLNVSASNYKLIDYGLLSLFSLRRMEVGGGRV